MYLHLIDDAVVVDHFVLRIRYNYPGLHRFLVLTSTGQFTHITPGSDVTGFVPTASNCSALAKGLGAYKAVFVHNLSVDKSRIVLEAPKEVVFVWAVWGYDYYHVYPQLFGKIFLPCTRLANVLLGKMSLSYQYLQSMLLSGFRINYAGRIQQRAAARINYTCNTLPRHSEIFRMISMPQSRRFHMAYYTIESITRGVEVSWDELGYGILIGNSASNTSNHIDLFIKLRRHFSGQKLVVVMGYGSARYRNLINVTGKFLFGDHYHAINKRLPLELYNHMLMDCNVMIHNHRRVQGIGNLLFGVWAGHKIYLREENPAYSWLTDMGVRVYSIQSDWPAGRFTPLAPEWRVKNREIIEKYYSEANAIRDIRRILEALESDHFRLVSLSDLESGQQRHHS